MIKLEIETYGYALPCELKTFKINGVDADKNDFGRADSGKNFAIYSDNEKDPIMLYGCPNRTFKRKYFYQDETLDKYHITPSEYEEICDKLESLLDIGCCGWCI